MHANRMTEGSIRKALIYFSIPMILSNLFQQLYNTVDSIIVGNIVGKEALAAVGSSGPVIYLIVGFFIGLAAGAGVVVSQAFGARNKEKTHEAVHTSIAVGIIFGAIMTVVGVVITPTLLKYMGVPDSVMGESVMYLRVYFAGILPIMLYNMGSSIIQAIGDSKTPLYILVTASILNIVLDFVFVGFMDMGIFGAAFATVLSQVLSAILALIKLIKTNDSYKLVIKDIKIHKKTLKRIIKFGLPGGIQNTIVSVSNIVVQSNINSFGAIAMAGCSAYQKIEGFAVLTTSSLSMAVATFTGQNIGAGNMERVKKGIKTGVLMSVGTMAVVSVVTFIVVPKMIGIFNDDPGVIYYGIRMMQFLVPGYIFVSMSDTLAGSLRGMGRSLEPMLVIIGCWCGLRMTWIYFSTKVINDIAVVFLGYPISWVASAIILVTYMKFKVFNGNKNESLRV